MKLGWLDTLLLEVYRYHDQYIIKFDSHGEFFASQLVILSLARVSHWTLLALPVLIVFFAIANIIFVCGNNIIFVCLNGDRQNNCFQ